MSSVDWNRSNEAKNNPQHTETSSLSLLPWMFSISLQFQAIEDEVIIVVCFWFSQFYSHVALCCSLGCSFPIASTLKRWRFIPVFIHFWSQSRGWPYHINHTIYTDVILWLHIEIRDRHLLIGLYLQFLCHLIFNPSYVRTTYKYVPQLLFVNTSNLGRMHTSMPDALLTQRNASSITRDSLWADDVFCVYTVVWRCSLHVFQQTLCLQNSNASPISYS